MRDFDDRLQTPAEMTEQRSRSAAQVRDVLSTPSDDLQDLVDLLRTTTGVLLAAVTVEHDGAFHYLICSGLEPFSNPSENALCTLAIREEKTFVIEDLSLDARTANMPVVDGTAMSLRFYASAPLYAPDGELVGRLCLFDGEPRKLSPQEQLLLEVLARNVAAVVDLRLREEKLTLRGSVDDRTTTAAGRLAHELRTPLVTMSGGIELLGEMIDFEAGPSIAPAFKLVERSTRRMVELVDSMLRLVHSDATDVADADLAEILEQVRQDLAGSISAINAQVIDDGLGTMPCDAGQIRVVLQNLIGNSLKFTRAKVIPVIAVRSMRRDDVWRIEVDDNGTGIPAEQREKIFELFSRLTTRQGFGIGLSTVAQIVEGHGGRLGVEDVPDGPGSRFWIEVPAAA